MFRLALVWSLFVVILMGCSAIETGRSTQANLDFINQHLDVEEIKLGMSEEEVIQYWGPGEYQEGFGGHFRKYEEKGIDIGIAGDSDNDLYNKISQLYVKHPAYRVFSISVGDKKNEGLDKLREDGFSDVDYSDDTLVKGEFSIALHGGNQIEAIRISFEDKDLKDRNY